MGLEAAGRTAAGDRRREVRARSLAAVRRVPDEKAYLYQIVQTIGSGPDLDSILHGIVRVVTEATGCHACFIYFVQGDRLALRAASSVYAHLEGKVTLPVGEGLAGWAVKTRRSAFIKENALEDPRVVYLPELEEERFQSLVSVPMFGRSGEVLGVISLHAEAPHEFDRADLDFLEHTASLVAGAVENARLYEDATARVELLTNLSRLAQRIASAQSIDDLLPTVAAGCRDLLGAERCEIYLLDDGGQLNRRAASPESPARAVLDTRRLWLDALGAGSRSPEGEDEPSLAEAMWGEGIDGTPLFALLAMGDERLGVIGAVVPSPAPAAQSALTAVASHAAVAIKRHELIDWLREKNLVKDFFEALSRGDRVADIAVPAGRLGFDLDAPHVVLHATPWAPAAPVPRRGSRARGPKEAGPPEWRDL